MSTTSKFDHLRAKFADLNKTTGTGPTKLNTDQATTVIEVLNESVGVGVAFEVKGLSLTIKEDLWNAAGVAGDLPKLTAHALSLKTAQILRQAKELEINGIVLLNEPQEGNRPSKWALFKAIPEVKPATIPPVPSKTS